eukprot:g4487.t1
MAISSENDTEDDGDCRVIEVPAKFFRQPKDSVESDVRTIMGNDSLMHYHAVLDMNLARSCIGCLIRKLGLGSVSEDFGSYEIVACRVAAHMRLDRAAVGALNLFPTPQEHGRYTNILSVLDRCVTSGMGTRLLKRWIRQPLTDIAKIRDRQAMVQAFVEEDILRQTLREGPLKGVMDVPKSLRKLERGKGDSSAKLKDLYLIYRLAFQLPEIIAPMEEYAGEQKEALRSKLLSPLKKSATNLEGLVQLCEHVIDLKRAESMPPEYYVDPYKCGQVLNDGDYDLADLSGEMDVAKQDIRNMYDDVASGWGRGLDIKLEDDKTSGFCMRHSKKKQKIVQSSARKAGVTLTIVKLVNKGVYFRTDAMTRKARKLRDLTSRYQSAQRKVVEEAVGVALTYAPVLESTAIALSQLDVFLSLAHVAVHAPCGGYCKPEMCESGDVILEGARHPCVELQDLPGGGDFIANNYTLTRRSPEDGVETKEEENGHFVVMTGPNMGGKSTYIRQLGTIAVMAQIGSFVPCRAARLPIFDAVLARVGAGDYQLRGVSTFMAEMLEAAAILETATSRSLVIIDELGRGTSTYDGFGLAWAIAEHLATKTKCFTLFATHFHEMTAMATRFFGVVNRHVSAHTTDDSITMLYQVERGPCDRSFGVHVAELARFPNDVIRDAKRRVREMEGGCKSDGGTSAKKVRTVASSALDDKTNAQNFLRQFVALPLDTMNTPGARRDAVLALLAGEE